MLDAQKGEIKRYVRFLEIVVGVSGKDHRTSIEDFNLIDATAAQHAEAFGLTMGLWK